MGDGVDEHHSDGRYETGEGTIDSIISEDIVFIPHIHTFLVHYLHDGRKGRDYYDGCDPRCEGNAYHFER